MSEWVYVAAINEIAENGWKIISIDNTDIVIVRSHHQFFALENICTHDGSPLAGEPLENDTIVCPRHGARFCIKTGKVLEGPAYEDTKSYPIKVENEKIYIFVED